MIVDDEPLFRDFLVNFIPWEEYGFIIVAEAKNGLEALKLADEKQPDVVLTDINMPKMDGLEFASQLLKIAPETAIVFITGHNEFEYARKAIRLGASDYILKPFEKEELILTLLKLKDNLHEANKHSMSDVNEDTSFMMPLLTSKIHSSNQSLQSKLKDYGFSNPNARYCVVCLDIDHLNYTINDQEEKMLWRFSVMNILKELLQEKEKIDIDKCHIFYDYEGNITCIFENEDEEISPDYKMVFNHLLEAVSKYLDFSITIGISTIREGLEAISSSYNEALSALHHKYIEESSRIIYYNEMQDESKDFSFYNATFNEQLLSSLRSKDIETSTQLLHDLYQNIRDKHISYDFTRIIQMGVISLLLSYITQSGKSTSIIFASDFSPFNAFDKADTLELQEDLVTSLFSKTINYFTTHQPSRTQQIALQGKNYIDENYANSSLNVQDIASAQYINQTYLRSMFKKEYGLTISDYITKTRMEAAAALLKQKTHRLADIAETVGYNDSSYFSKCFKKFYGMSPSQYEIT